MDSRFDTLFLHARELATPAGREAFLDEACAGDADLRAKLEARLISEVEAAAYFGEAVTHVDPGTRANLPGEEPGAFVGPFKLLQQIGEGGFGTVWMADQQAPVRRRVALKIIKPGLDTKEVIARFEQERQALAMMDHANIARVFDAGATQSGRPFFVMELVRGTKITEYCDEHELGIPDRVRLFIQVCHAVHHAHQKGIIHRDIKPSNVLVTINDGEAVVKVIDFGVAKATQGSLTDATLFTQFHQMIGTPAYMSPEQAEMTSLDIDTRSDIYSLGVLLYELVTGRTPIDSTTLARAGLDEIRRVIREVTPPRPSERVKTLSAEELTTTAKRRRTEVTKLTTSLRGDLDWIAMMCLEKDRKRRYDSANALALDLQRYLGHGIVTARPPTASYLLSRIVRRHRTTFIAGSAIALSLLAGLAVSTWLFFKEKEAVREQSRLRGEAEQAKATEQAQRTRAEAGEKTAKTESERSERVSAFLKEMLEGVGPSKARGRDTAMLREILDKTATRLDSELKGQPEVEADLRNTLGEVYRALGVYGKAEALLRQALEFAKTHYGDQDPRTIASLGNLGLALDAQRKIPEAELLMREALRIRRASSTGDDEPLVTCIHNMAMVLMNGEKYAEAEPLHREALAMMRRLKGDDDVRTAMSLQGLATTLRHAGKLDEAETAQREAVALFRRLVEENDPVMATAMQRLATLLRDRGNFAGAETVQREAVENLRTLLSGDHLDLSGSIYLLATMLHVQRKLPEAVALYREAVALRRKLLGKDDADTCQFLTDLGSALRLQGEMNEAETLHRESLTKLRDLVNGDHGYMIHALNGLANDCRDLGKLEEAETLLREALRICTKLHSPEHPGVAATRNDLAIVLDMQGKHAEAEAAHREVLAVQKKILGIGHQHVARSLSNLAQMLVNQNKLVEAGPVLEEAMESAAKRAGKQSVEYAGAIHSLVRNLIHRREFVMAEPLARECLELREKNEPEEWTTFFTRTMLGKCLLAQKNYKEAEPLLLSGADGMLQRKDAIPKGEQTRRIAEAINAVVELYTESGHPEKAAPWKRKLDDFNGGKKASDPRRP